MKETWTWSEFKGGPWKWLDGFHIIFQHARRGWESWVCSGWRKEGSGGISSMYITWIYLSKDEEATFFLLVPSDRTRSNGHRLKQRQFHLKHKKKNFYGEAALVFTGASCPERLWKLHHWRFSNLDSLTGQSPEQPSPADPPLQEVRLETLRGAF